MLGLGRRAPSLQSNQCSNSSSQRGESHAYIAILKCAVGAGLFTLPYSFSAGGLYLSSFLTLMIGFMCMITFELICKCQVKVYHNQRNTHDGSDPSQTSYDNNAIRYFYSYAEIGKFAYPEVSLSIGGRSLNLVEGLVNVGILLTSIGVSAAYIDFISENVPVIIHNFFPKSEIIDSRIIPWVIFPILLVFCCQSSFKKLNIASIAGDLAVITGLVLILVYGAVHVSQHDSKSKNFTSEFPAISSTTDGINSHTLLYYFGSTSFLFAIHAVILPVLRDTLSDQNNDVFVMKYLYFFITIVNTAFGAIGYVLFSAEGLRCPNEYFPISYSTDHSFHPINRGPCPSILSNIQHGAVLSIAKLFICIDLLCTIPLVVGASRQILDATLTRFIETLMSSACKSAGLRSHVIHSAFEPRENSQNVSYDALDQLGSTHEVSNPMSSVLDDENNSGLLMVVQRDDSDSSVDMPQSSPSISQYSSSCRDINDSVTSFDAIPSTEPIPSLSPDVDLPCRHLAVLLSRFILLFLIVLVSLNVPHFGDVVSLVGGLVCALTGYILPPLLYIRLFPSECSWQTSPTTIISLYLIMLFGVFSIVVSLVII